MLFVCLCRFLPKNTKMEDDGKTRRELKRPRRNKTRIYVLLDIKNSKPTRAHTCIRSKDVRSIFGVVATVDFFFAMVVCFTAAFFLFLPATHSFFERFFHPHFLLPFFISLSLISSLSFSHFISRSLSLSLSLSLFLSSCSLESFRSISFLTLFARFHCCC